MGPIRTWLPPYKPHSEFNIIDSRHLKRLLKYLGEIIIPPIPVKRPEWLSFLPETLFLRGTEIFSQPDHQEKLETFPDETWFFINGVATNKDIAEMNSQYLAQLFHRPITVIQNPTDFLLVDLIESAIGKTWKRNTEPAKTALDPIGKALSDPEKKHVVVIAHSQGTIIMANVLRTLIKESGKSLGNVENLKKLEIYTFGNCADEMTYIPDLKTSKTNPVPWIENFANQYDLVARLGILAPKKAKRKINIDGDRYVTKDQWGHFLNEHYLFTRLDYDEVDYKPVKDKKARLYGYLNGRTQPSY